MFRWLPRRRDPEDVFLLPAATATADEARGGEVKRNGTIRDETNDPQRNGTDRNGAKFKREYAKRNETERQGCQTKPMEWNEMERKKKKTVNNGTGK